VKKRKAKGTGLSARDAAFEAAPDMVNLDQTLRGLLKVPKTELDARIEAEKGAVRRQKE
jgi:hypothetical protein